MFAAWVLGQQVGRAVYWALLTPVVLWLWRNLPLSGPRRYLHLLVHVALASIGMLVFFFLRVPVLWWLYGLPADFDLIGAIPGQFNGRNVIDLVLYAGIGLAAWMAGERRQRRELEQHESQLKAQLVQAELAALKQQVQPHFLFNSLNAVAALVRAGESGKAVETLARLSGLLRRLMSGAGRPEIELHQELDYIQDYLAVEQVRFEERLRTEFDADEACLRALVPTLILQPLVENAVKHGIARRRSPGRIRIAATRRADHLRLEVWNDPAETTAEGPASASGHGIGLTATRARLERAYGPAARLEEEIDGPGGTRVAIEFPLRFPATPSP